MITVSTVLLAHWVNWRCWSRCWLVLG